MSCYKCNAKTTKMCDGEVVTKGKTCDREMCNQCAHTVKEGIACVRGKGKQSSHAFTVDYCDECNENGGKRKPDKEA